MFIKRFLGPEDNEENSFEVVIPRKKLIKLLIMEGLIGKESPAEKDIDMLIDEIPIDVMEGFMKKAEINVTERLRIYFKLNDDNQFPYPYIRFKDGDEWCDIDVWYAYDEEDIEQLSAGEIIKKIYDDSRDEGFYDIIKGNYVEMKRYRATKLPFIRSKKYGIRDIDFEDFMRNGISGRGHVKIKNIPTLGWARFLSRCISERRECSYYKRIAKEKDGYRVIANSPVLLTGRKKVYKFYRYYADRMGLANKNLLRSRYDMRAQSISQMRACDFMYDIYRYIDEHGEDSDEDIVAWLQTAKRY